MSCGRDTKSYPQQPYQKIYLPFSLHPPETCMPPIINPQPHLPLTLKTDKEKNLLIPIL